MLRVQNMDPHMDARIWRDILGERPTGNPPKCNFQRTWLTITREKELDDVIASCTFVVFTFTTVNNVLHLYFLNFL